MSAKPASSYARALAVVLLTLLSAYTITLPARSTTAADTALLLVETNHLTEARDSAIQARRLNPVSSTALLARANVESAAGDREAALALHRRAAREQPRDPDLWLALARYLADGMGRPREALRPARVALYLDPQAPRAGDVFLGLRARVRSEDAARGTPVPAPAPEGELEIIP